MSGFLYETRLMINIQGRIPVKLLAEYLMATDIPSITTLKIKHLLSNLKSIRFTVIVIIICTVQGYLDTIKGQ